MNARLEGFVEGFDSVCCEEKNALVVFENSK